MLWLSQRRETEEGGENKVPSGRHKQSQKFILPRVSIACLKTDLIHSAVKSIDFPHKGQLPYHGCSHLVQFSPMLLTAKLSASRL